MITNEAPVIYKIAEFITSGNKNDFSHNTFQQAKRVIADTVGTAYSGIRSEAFKIAVKSLDNAYPTGNCDVWGTKMKFNVYGAVFFNALAVSLTDFDEGHRKAVGHPASVVVPVAFALGDEKNISYDRVVKAVIIGYEVATRFSSARIAEKITTWSTGRWGAIGGAATAAMLLSLTIDQTIHALSLAAILSPAMLGGSTDVSTGSMAKEGVAWAAQTGLHSALLAKNGFVAPYLFIDGHDDYNKEKLIENLGGTWFIDSNYFKPYACCRWLHSAIEAGIALKNEHCFNINDVKKIYIEIFGRAVDLASNVYPANTIQGQFHLPFTLSVALKYGKVLPGFFDASHLKDKDIRRLIDKIEIKPSPDYDKVFPGKLPSKVSILTKDDNKYSKEVIYAPWGAGGHPDDEELFQKFIDQTGEKGIAVWRKLLQKQDS